MPRKAKTETKTDAKTEPKVAAKTEGKTEHKTHEAKKPVVKKIPVQPVINIGLVGHVDHGKTTLTERLSGKWTDTHSEELKRGITIRLGYADAVFYKCPKCEGTEAYTTKPKCDKCGGPTIPQRKVSFVDAPGHESLMATMLSGASILDGAYLLISATEDCPQPQTREHLMALKIVGIENVVIIQNKIDLVSDEEAKRNYEQIKEFLKGTKYEKCPIIPVSARYGLNIGALIAATENAIPTPVRDSSQKPLMFVARSFDVNKPGTAAVDIVGGVLGGSLKRGMLHIGDQIEIRPGHEVERRNQKIYEPIHTRVSGLMTGNTKVEEIGPGGSVGVMTELDPSIVKADSLTGALAGLPGELPATLSTLNIEVNLLKRVVGAKDNLLVEPLKIGEILMLNVNSAATVGTIKSMKKETVELGLKIPVCAENGSRVTLSRRIDNRRRLIGYGLIK